MTPIVVDTDVVSFLFKNDSRAQSYLPPLGNRKLLVSFRTEAELEQWILLANWGAGRILRFHEFMTGFESVPSSRDPGSRPCPQLPLTTDTLPTVPPPR